uniref:FUS-interacting serine-arginine-rich protein 1 n=1 Tax=Rhizophora mucronata TaxID=61149 RepID=A0A2P2KN61_RHIMU
MSSLILLLQAKRRRGRTPTPGRYLGLRTMRGMVFSFNVVFSILQFLCSLWRNVFSPFLAVRHRTPSYSPRQVPSHSPYRRSYSRSPSYLSERSRSRSYSPYYSRRSYSPRYHRRRSYSPYHRRRRSYSRSRSPYYYSRRRSYSRSRSPYYYHSRRRSYSRLRSPYYYHSRQRSYSRSSSLCSRSPVSRRDQSYSPSDTRYTSPDDQYIGRHHCHSISRSPTPRPARRSSRSYSRSISPRPISSRRRYSCSVSPVLKRSSRSPKRSLRKSCTRSPTIGASSRSVSRSVTPKSTSPSS